MKPVKASLFVFAWLLAASVLAAQNPVNVLVNTNGTLRFPTNLFAANSNLLNAAVSGASAFTTGAGVTNIAGVVSANLTNGANVTLTTNANGVISIAATGGSATTNFTTGITIGSNINWETNIFVGTSALVSANGPSVVDITPSGNFTLSLADIPTTGRRAFLVRFHGDGASTLTLAGAAPTLRNGVFVNPPRNGLTEYLFENIGAAFEYDVYQPIQASELPTGIDATRIADGSVDNSAFQFLDGASGNLQAQINALGSPVWTNSAGILQPSTGQTANTLSFTSQSADNATNVALVVDTEVPWTSGGSLASFKNGGNDRVTFLADGQIYFTNPSFDPAVAQYADSFNIDAFFTGTDFSSSPALSFFGMYGSGVDGTDIGSGFVATQFVYLQGFARTNSVSPLDTLVTSIPPAIDAGIIVENSDTGNSAVGLWAATDAATIHGYGVVGLSVRATGNSVGVAGSGDFRATNAVGGYFELVSTNRNSAPNLTTSVLLLDNRNTGSPLLIARDNGTNKFTVGPSGNVTAAGEFISGGTNILAALAGKQASGSYAASGANADITSMSALANIGNGSTATYALTFNLSGATDPVVTAANGSLTSSVQIIVPDGSVSTPGLRGSDADTGITFDGVNSGRILFNAAGVNNYILDSSYLNLYILNGGIRFRTGADLINDNGVVNTLQIGNDAAAPASQTFKGPDGSGTDKVGGDFILGAGKPTGTGTPGKVKVTVTGTGTGTGSSQQSYTTAVALGGQLKTDTTTTGNVGAGEDDLISFTIPAQQLGSNGDAILFDVAGTFAATVNTKQLKIKFGGTTILDTTSLVFNGVSWRGHGRIIRTSATTQKCTTEFTVGGTLLSAVNSTITAYTTAAETLSSGIAFKVTGQDTGGIPASDAVVQEIESLTWVPGL